MKKNLTEKDNVSFQAVEVKLSEKTVEMFDELSNKFMDLNFDITDDEDSLNEEFSKAIRIHFPDSSLSEYAFNLLLTIFMKYYETYRKQEGYMQNAN